MYTIDYTPYKLRDWIDIDKLEWGCISFNPNSMHLLEQNQDKIDWERLGNNPNAIHLFEQNLDTTVNQST